MESICDELYYGKINASEMQPIRTKEYLTASKEATDALKALQATLGPEQLALLEKAMSKLSAENTVLLRQMYSEGIYFGTRLLSELYTEALHKQTDRVLGKKEEQHHD